MSTPPSPPHLVGAIRNFLLATPTIAGPLTGGIADSQAGRDDAAPYLVLQVKDSHSLRVFGGGEVYWATVWFEVFHTGRSTVESIANLIRDAILPPADQPAWSPLGIADGWIDTNRQPAGGDSIEIDPEIRAAFGKDVWCCRRPITWTIARG
jgi:hypothetical protein